MVPNTVTDPLKARKCKPEKIILKADRARDDLVLELCPSDMVNSDFFSVSLKRKLRHF